MEALKKLFQNLADRKTMTWEVKPVTGKHGKFKGKFLKDKDGNIIKRAVGKKPFGKKDWNEAVQGVVIKDAYADWLNSAKFTDSLAEPPS